MLLKDRGETNSVGQNLPLLGKAQSPSSLNLDDFP